MSKGENMVERVALTFAQWGDAFSTHYSQPNSEMGWDDYSPTEQLIALAATRAVIEALMEPTPEMIKAGIGVPEVEAVDWVGALFATGIGSYEQIMMASHQAMLRTALSKPNDEGEGK
jgi:hypothetical protein